MSMMMLAGLFLWLAWSPSDDSLIDPGSTIPSTETRSVRVSGSRALTNTNVLPVGAVLVPSAIFDPSQHPDWRLKTLSIEDLRVGMRVPALNPEGSSFQNDAVAGEHRPEQSSRRDAETRRGTEDDELGLETGFGNPDPETWRVFRLEVEKQDQSGALEVTLLRPADWLVEQQQSTALLALLAELQVSQATAPPPATADFLSFVVQSPSLSIFQRGPEQVLASLDQVLAAAPKVGRLGAQGLTSGALDIVRESLTCSLVDGAEADLAWQDQVAAVLDGSAAGSLIWLEMPELGAVGLATVKSIEPCPPIKSGPGRIVTASFRHASAEVLDLTFAPNLPSSLTTHISTRTTDSSPLTLGVTAAHPFWSIDRESFVPAGELRPQEQVIGIDGQHFRLTSITPRAGPETVYNLEVALDHVYYVSEGGVLVHNSCTKLADALHQFTRYGENSKKGASTALAANLRKAKKSVNGIVEPRAHHLIPTQVVRENADFFEKAARAGWNMNAASNGAWVSKKFHGSHPAYNEFVGNAIAAFRKSNPDATGPQIRAYLDEVTHNLESMILGNRGTGLNQMF